MKNGQKYSLMDIYNYCLLTEPSGLGYSYTNTYEQIGNKFVNSLKKINQSTFSGQVNFLNYDNYLAFVNFIEKSNDLKLMYKVPYKSEEVTYYRNVEIQSVSKTEIRQNNVLSETVEFNFTSLWYIVETTTYEIIVEDDAVCWDFTWDSRFLSNNNNAIDYTNNGQVPARVLIELEGYVVNPTFKVEQNGKELYSIPINATINIGEKLIFSSLENNFYIKKINMVTEEETDLYNLDNIDFNKDYILTMPIGNSTLSITTEDILYQTKVNIYTYYKAV